MYSVCGQLRGERTNRPAQGQLIVKRTDRQTCRWQTGGKVGAARPTVAGERAREKQTDRQTDGERQREGQSGRGKSVRPDSEISC